MQTDSAWSWWLYSSTGLAGLIPKGYTLIIETAMAELLVNYYNTPESANAFYGEMALRKLIENN